MNRTGIEYLTHSWSPIAMRCTPVSAGCTNCWHRRMADRLKENKNLSFDVRRAYAGEGPPVLVEERLVKPLRRKKPARIGTQFMGDLFNDDVPESFIFRVFRITREVSQHQFLILTKRPGRMLAFMHEYYARLRAGYGSRAEEPQRNVWLSVSIENQAAADERREYLRQTPAAVKFVSYEPALGPVDWTGWEFVNQIISGGESGPKARPSHPDWHRATRDFCQKHGIAYFFKQHGEWLPGCKRLLEEGYGKIWTVCPRDQDDKQPQIMWRVGKKRAGHLLDGKEWREFPD